MHPSIKEILSALLLIGINANIKIKAFIKTNIGRLVFTVDLSNLIGFITDKLPKIKKQITYITSNNITNN